MLQNDYNQSTGRYEVHTGEQCNWSCPSHSYERATATGGSSGGSGGSSGGGGEVILFIPVALFALIYYGTTRYAEYPFPLSWMVGLYYFTIRWPVAAVWSITPTDYHIANVLIRIGIYSVMAGVLYLVVTRLYWLIKQFVWVILAAYLMPGVVALLWIGVVALIGPLLHRPIKTIDTPFGKGASPDGADVVAFTKAANLPGDQKDNNSPDWAAKTAGPEPDTISGAWSSRWNNTTSPNLEQAGKFGVWFQAEKTEVKSEGEKVYMLVRGKRTTSLLVLRRDGNKLSGRYVSVGNPKEAGLFAGVIVDHKRIDGIWRGAKGKVIGRWDFRR